MKKSVAAALLLCFLLAGCQGSGYSRELTSSSWSASTPGGGSAELSFEGENARLDMKNGTDSVSISGRYLADEETLVIFDSSVCRNYSFDYRVSGDSLVLSTESGELRLAAQLRTEAPSAQLRVEN